MRRLVGGVLPLLLASSVALAGCAADDGSSATGAPASTPSSPTASAAPTLSMLPMPSKTLSGGLTAELQQSSRDVALGRFQVWITNGLDHEITPRKIVYRDDLLVRPVVGERLRSIPSGAYRGYPLELIEPTCRGEETGATVTVDYGDEVVDVQVEDETSVVGRWSTERCAEIVIDRIAPLEWTPGIEVRGTGADAIALFRLTAHPTGDGGSYTVDTVGGTPLFGSADGDFWTVGKKIDGTGGDVTMELPAQPARCDSHAFGAAGGGTTFFVNVTIAGHGRESGPQQIRLAMSPEVTSETFAYAAEACGWDE
jgi:hypothetical protein